MPAAVVKDGTVMPKFRQGKISPLFLTAKFSPGEIPPPLYQGLCIRMQYKAVPGDWEAVGGQILSVANVGGHLVAVRSSGSEMDKRSQKEGGGPSPPPHLAAAGRQVGAPWSAESGTGSLSQLPVPHSSHPQFRSPQNHPQASR